MASGRVNECNTSGLSEMFERVEAGEEGAPLRKLVPSAGSSLGGDSLGPDPFTRSWLLLQPRSWGIRRTSIKKNDKKNGRDGTELGDRTNLHHKCIRLS